MASRYGTFTDELRVLARELSALEHDITRDPETRPRVLLALFTGDPL